MFVVSSMARWGEVGLRGLFVVCGVRIAVWARAEFAVVRSVEGRVVF